jgi:hypothetical protein
MPNVTGPNRRPPAIDLAELKGKEIASGKDKVGETASTKIELSTEIQPGFYVPDLKLSPRTVKDPELREKIIDLPPERLANVRTAEDYKTLLNELKEQHKNYLLPDKREFAEKAGDDTNFAYLNVTGRRIEQFYDEAQGLIRNARLTGAEATAARKEVNISHADAYRGRDINFDRSDTSSYWSYGNDAPFAHVYEKMLDALPTDDPRRPAIQNQLDYIFTHKYVVGGGVREEDAERSIGLVAIDKDSRNTVSLNPATKDSPQPTYQTIQINPAIDNEHAGKNVLWDNKADKYFFQGTREEVPADLQDKFVRTPVDNVVFRRAKEGEQLRDGFNFDWNSNRMIDQEKIDTSWWGHCDIQALMESRHIDMKDSGGVQEYRSASGKTTEYKRSDLLEAMSSTMNMDSQYLELGTGRAVSFGKTEFGGSRNDDRPDNIYLNVGGNYKPFNVRIQSMSKPDKPEEMVAMDKIFDQYKMTENDRGFEKNEEFNQQINGDVNVINGDKRIINARNEYYTVNERGQWVENKDSITIDPSKDEKVLMGTEIRSIGNHSLTRHYYNPKTKELSSADVTFKRNEEGKYVAEERNVRNMGTSRGMMLAREMQQGDDVEGKARLTDGAIRTGTSIATDSSAGSQVWNGVVYNLREDVAWRSDDGKFEKIDIKAASRYGSGTVGSKVNELDDQGKVVRSFETKAAGDFHWSSDPRVAPIIHENGKWYINKAMQERGILDLNDIHTSLNAMTDLNDLIYLGLSGKDRQPMYTIVHDGKRLVYDNKEAWEADVKKLEEAANAIDQ